MLKSASTLSAFLCCLLAVACAGLLVSDAYSGKAGQGGARPTAGSQLALRATLNRPRYAADDPMFLEVRLINVGTAPVTVNRDMPMPLMLVHQGAFRERNGVHHFVLQMFPRPGKAVREYVELRPGYFYGVRMALKQRYRITEPGKYAFTLTYYSEDDGSRAGLKAFVGGLRCQGPVFEISRGHGVTRGR